MRVRDGVVAFDTLSPQKDFLCVSTGGGEGGELLNKGGICGYESYVKCPAGGGQCGRVGVGDAVGGKGERFRDSGRDVSRKTQPADRQVADFLFTNPHSLIIEFERAYTQQRVVLYRCDGDVIQVKPIVPRMVAEGQIDGLADVIRQRDLIVNIHPAVCITGVVSVQFRGEIAHIVASGGHIDRVMLIRKIVGLVFDVEGEHCGVGDGDGLGNQPVIDDILVKIIVPIGVRTQRYFTASCGVGVGVCLPAVAETAVVDKRPAVVEVPLKTLREGQGGGKGTVAAGSAQQKGVLVHVSRGDERSADIPVSGG